jgi:Protein of unknown function (DUF2934)
MQEDIEKVIRERAYQIWNDGGRQDGRSNAHWLEAEREVLLASLSELGTVMVQSEKRSKPKKALASRKKQRAA